MEVLDKRIPLVSEPTPFSKLKNISKQLNRDIYLKEDDATGICMGGSKIRKLEYLMFDAQSKQADTVITTGGVQSNHTRLTTAVARKFGLKPELVLRRIPQHDKMSSGNFFLNHLMGAELHYVESRDQGDVKMKEREQQLKEQGKNPYIIPPGGSNPVGILGYVRAAQELKTQLRDRGITKAVVVMPVGSGGTMTGVLIANKLWDMGLHVLGVSVSRAGEEIRPRVNMLISETLEFMNLDPTDYDIEEPVIYEEFIGPGYAQLDSPTAKTVKRLAESDGVILDPVYTGKAMNGFLSLFEQKAEALLDVDYPVVFWHTGGLPALFAFEDDLRELIQD